MVALVFFLQTIIFSDAANNWKGASSVCNSPIREYLSAFLVCCPRHSPASKSLCLTACADAFTLLLLWSCSWITSRRRSWCLLDFQLNICPWSSWWLGAILPALFKQSKDDCIGFLAGNHGYQRKNYDSEHHLPLKASIQWWGDVQPRLHQNSQYLWNDVSVSFLGLNTFSWQRSALWLIAIHLSLCENQLKTFWSDCVTQTR